MMDAKERKMYGRITTGLKLENNMIQHGLRTHVISIRIANGLEQQ